MQDNAQKCVVDRASALDPAVRACGGSRTFSLGGQWGHGFWSGGIQSEQLQLPKFSVFGVEFLTPQSHPRSNPTLRVESRGSYV